MEEYGKNGKMSLEEVLELYNGQEDEDKKEDIAGNGMMFWFKFSIAGVHRQFPPGCKWL